MRQYLLVILFFSPFVLLQSQNNLLIGKWLECKREIPENYRQESSYQSQLFTNSYFEFFADSSFNYKDLYPDNNPGYMDLSEGKINLFFHGGDCNSGAYEFNYILSKNNKTELLTLSSPSGITYQFKKVKRFQKNTQNKKQVKKFYGQWKKFKTEISNVNDPNKYFYKGQHIVRSSSFILPIGRLDHYNDTLSVNYIYCGGLINNVYLWNNGMLIEKKCNDTSRLCFINYYKKVDEFESDLDTMEKYDTGWMYRAASFPGGNDSLMAFYSRKQGKLEYKKEASSRKVPIFLYINEKGAIIHAELTEKLVSKKDAAKAMRIIEEMPDWEPALDRIYPESYRKSKCAIIIYVPIFD